MVQVLVRDNNVDQALRALTKKMQREGIFREMKMRRAYEKPSAIQAPTLGAASSIARSMDFTPGWCSMNAIISTASSTPSA